MVSDSHCDKAKGCHPRRIVSTLGASYHPGKQNTGEKEGSSVPEFIQEAAKTGPVH